MIDKNGDFFYNLEGDIGVITWYNYKVNCYTFNWAFRTKNSGLINYDDND